VIVDAHIHLLGWMSCVQPAASRLRARLPEYGLGPDAADEAAQRTALMDAAGVGQAVVVNNRSGPELGVFTPNQTLAEQVGRFPTRLFFLAGVTLRPQPDLAEMREGVVRLGARGFKITPAISYVYPDDFDLLDPLYRQAIELDVPLMWHIGSMGSPGARRVFTGIDRLSEVVYRYPELRHIIAHLGGHGPPGVERDVIEFAASRPNVYLDASYVFRAALLRHMPLGMQPAAQRYARLIFDGVSPELRAAVGLARAEHRAIIRQAANMCPDRFMFGSDAPEALSMQLAVELYQDALGDSELYTRVMAENARRLFRLP
jgi:predicted TIM-barrel fold metal-dependent hydrolase